MPLDTVVVRPRGYARMLPAAGRALLARLGPDPDWVTPDPAWVRRDIRTARVPVIATVTCTTR